MIVADAYGNESVQAATILTSHDYKNVAVLFDGIYKLITTSNGDANCKNTEWQQNRKYHTLTGDEFNELAKQNKNPAILDVRNTAEYNSQSKDSWRNIGHIKM